MNEVWISDILQYKYILNNPWAILRLRILLVYLKFKFDLAFCIFICYIWQLQNLIHHIVENGILGYILSTILRNQTWVTHSLSHYTFENIFFLKYIHLSYGHCFNLEILQTMLEGLHVCNLKKSESLSLLPLLSFSIWSRFLFPLLMLVHFSLVVSAGTRCLRISQQDALEPVFSIWI